MKSYVFVSIVSNLNYLLICLNCLKSQIRKSTPLHTVCLYPHSIICIVSKKSTFRTEATNFQDKPLPYEKKWVTLHLKIGDGHRFRPKSSGQKRQALFPSCESYGQVCTWKSETGTVSVRRAPDKNDKPYFLRANPTDKFALENSSKGLIDRSNLVGETGRWWAKGSKSETCNVSQKSPSAHADCSSHVPPKFLPFFCGQE